MYDLLGNVRKTRGVEPDSPRVRLVETDSLTDFAGLRSVLSYTAANQLYCSVTPTAAATGTYDYDWHWGACPEPSALQINLARGWRRPPGDQQGRPGQPGRGGAGAQCGLGQPELLPV